LLARLTGLIALLLACFGAWTFTATSDRTALARGLLWLGASIPMFWATLALLTASHPEDALNHPDALPDTYPPDTYSDEMTDPPRRWWHVVGVFVGTVLLIFMGDFIARVLRVESWLPTSEHFQVGLLIAGCVLIEWGL